MPKRPCGRRKTLICRNNRVARGAERGGCFRTERWLFAHEEVFSAGGLLRTLGREPSSPRSPLRRVAVCARCPLRQRGGRLRTLPPRPEGGCLHTIRSGYQGGRLRTIESRRLTTSADSRAIWGVAVRARRAPGRRVAVCARPAPRPRWPFAHDGAQAGEWPFAHDARKRGRVSARNPRVAVRA